MLKKSRARYISPLYQSSGADDGLVCLLRADGICSLPQVYPPYDVVVLVFIVATIDIPYLLLHPFVPGRVCCMIVRANCPEEVCWFLLAVSMMLKCFCPRLYEQR